jgi:tripeptidyl-peptidase-1
MRYGQHLSAAEVKDLVRPSDEAISKVHDWLHSNNISPSQLQYSSAKDWLKVTLPVEAIEKLLNTNYSVYRHEDGDHIVRTPDWSLPKSLHEHVQTIQPTNSFFRPMTQRKTLKTFPIEDEIIIPAVSGNNKAVADVCNVNVSRNYLQTSHFRPRRESILIPSRL